MPQQGGSFGAGSPSAPSFAIGAGVTGARLGATEGAGLAVLAVTLVILARASWPSFSSLCPR